MSYVGSPSAPKIAEVSDATVTPAKLSTGHPNWDSSGNVGIGTSNPSAPLTVVGNIATDKQTISSWGATNTRALELTTYGAVSSNDSIGTAALSCNAYESADDSWNRVAGTSAAFYQQKYNGEHVWSQASAAAGGSAITWSEQMRINSSGIVTKPNHPLFSGYQSGSNTGSTGGSTDYLIVCNGSYVNNGSHYNTSTGVFTCPVDGIYIVHAYAMSITATADGVFYATRLRLYKNGAGIGNYAYNYGDGYRHVSGNWAINCSTNDTLGVMSNDSLGGYNWIIIQLVG